MISRYILYKECNYGNWKAPLYLCPIYHQSASREDVLWVNFDVNLMYLEKVILHTLVILLFLSVICPNCKKEEAQIKMPAFKLRRRKKHIIKILLIAFSEISNVTNSCSSFIGRFLMSAIYLLVKDCKSMIFL